MGKSDYPKFNGNGVDFMFWRRRFTSWCVLKDEKLGLVLKFAESRSHGDKEKIELEKRRLTEGDFKNVNEMLYHCLMMVLDRTTSNVVSSVVNVGDGAGAWCQLVKDFANRGELRQSQLRERLHTAKLASDGDMRTYLAEILEVVTQLRECGSVVEDSEAVSAIMRGLPKNYEDVKTLNSFMPSGLMDVF